MRIACFVESLHKQDAKVAPARRKYVLKATISLMIKKALSGLSQLSSGPGWRERDIIHLNGLGLDMSRVLLQRLVRHKTLVATLGRSRMGHMRMMQHVYAQITPAVDGGIGFPPMRCRLCWSKLDACQPLRVSCAEVVTLPVGARRGDQQ